ncbi:hypothetical protein, partial [Klebsiella pneumoniae]|uniref:hypothetical protein n=1 Tax=Klebsiella pneumoniae TaxID=573 RepID=UPI003B5A10F6
RRKQQRKTPGGKEKPGSKRITKRAKRCKITPKNVVIHIVTEKRKLLETRISKIDKENTKEIPIRY